MRTLKITFLLAIMLLAIPKIANAQQKFHVHEDVIKPAMTVEYENVLKDIYKLIDKNPVESLNMLVFQSNSNHYLFLHPISSMADLDNPSPLAKLGEKVGKEKVMDIVKRLDKCYDIEKDYVIELNSDLSYMPNGMTQTPEGENYRKNHFYHYTPENRAVVKEKIKAIKKFYESKGSKLHYRFYQSGFGTSNEYYMVSIAAKDEADYAVKIANNNTLLGDDWGKMYNDFLASLSSYNSLEGQIRPDLSIKSN